MVPELPAAAELLVEEVPLSAAGPVDVAAAPAAAAPPPCVHDGRLWNAIRARRIGLESAAELPLPRVLLDEEEDDDDLPAFAVGGATPDDRPAIFLHLKANIWLSIGGSIYSFEWFF